jgi:hypothetical protein
VTASARRAKEVAMIIRTLLAVALAAMAAATTGTAAGSPPQPKSLVLQKTDFAPGVRVIRTLPTGNVGHSVVYRYRGPSGPIDLTSSVALLGSPGRAHALFAQLRHDWKGLLDRMTKGTGYDPSLSLPRYGDEQMATYHGADGGKLLVRSGDRVWFLLLQDLSSQPGTRTLTKTQAAAELRKYGLRQKRRVGAG